MPQVDINTLKGYFNNGDVPNESNYIDLIDTIYSGNMSAIAIYQSLHALRGFWSMAFDENSRLVDYSGQGRTLLRGNSATVNNTESISALVPYAAFDAAAYDYFYRTSETGLALTGASGLIGVTAQRGITWGTWIRPGELPGATNRGIVTKYATTGNQRAYMLYTSSANPNRFRVGISTSGTAADNVQDWDEEFVVGNWYFLVARWIPSTSLTLFVNGRSISNTTSIVATVYNATCPFEIGSWNYAQTSTTWTHNQTLVFLCAAGLDDRIINALFHSTRALFGV